MHTALPALATVEHSSAGEQLVMNTLNTALQRAGSILGSGRPAFATAAADIATITRYESSGNPHAMNNRDSNTGAGTPSKGLIQTIDPTFAAYSLPGQRNIWDPVDNIVAGVRYAIERYGSVANVPGVGQLREGGSHVGY
ncbi:transglycosylase SLT domain-containing protein [Nocardia sp. NBC_01329]|uniref:transglycosylase SLT domain-containing protein n=1 Tax=Nocardia sp. NBC_01329 TaxID=2903594 RepID=UPI002E1290F7|nr:transglycosylase SLT domain-containing protein [Nocardia sp. NBC_01329]